MSTSDIDSASRHFKEKNPTKRFDTSVNVAELLTSRFHREVYLPLLRRKGWANWVFTSIQRYFLKRRYPNEYYWKDQYGTPSVHLRSAKCKNEHERAVYNWRGKYIGNIMFHPLEVVIDILKSDEGGNE
jgi:hypothetical protein